MPIHDPEAAASQANQHQSDSKVKELSKQRQWQLKMIETGRCCQCGGPGKIKNGRPLTRCVPCMAKSNAISSRKYYEAKHKTT